MNDDILSEFTLFGPTKDGRIKPDLVAASRVTAANADFDNNPATCDVGLDLGTSWSSPTVAGAAALVRQYYTDGFYPAGTRSPPHPNTPRAALKKAKLKAPPRPHHKSPDHTTNSTLSAFPAPSPQQGWGFPVLDDVLYFDGDTRRLRIADYSNANGLAQGESRTIRVEARAGTPLRAVLVWTDPPATARAVGDTTPVLVNDLDLNGSADHLNNVEVMSIANPSGFVDLTVTARTIGSGGRQGYALVITGDLVEPANVRRRASRH
jgi:hypothetical protein